MSWFKRKPKQRETSKLVPKNSSPLAEKVLKEQKDRVRGTDQPTPDRQSTRV